MYRGYVGKHTDKNAIRIMFGNIWSWDCDEKFFHQKVKLESDNMQEDNLQKWMPKVGTLYRVLFKVRDTTSEGYSKTRKEWLDGEVLGSTEFDKVLILTSHESLMLAFRKEDFEDRTCDRTLLQTADPLCNVVGTWGEDINNYVVPKQHQVASVSKRPRVGEGEVRPAKVLPAPTPAHYPIAYSLCILL